MLDPARKRPAPPALSWFGASFVGRVAGRCVTPAEVEHLRDHYARTPFVLRSTDGGWLGTDGGRATDGGW